jgi:hypothetical protein
MAGMFAMVTPRNGLGETRSGRFFFYADTQQAFGCNGI